MARRRFRTRYIPRFIRRRGRSRGRGMGGMMGLLTAAIATPIALYAVSKFAPSLGKYVLPAGIAGGGLATYLLDGSRAGQAVLGSALGIAALQAFMASQQPQTVGGTGWS